MDKLFVLITKALGSTPVILLSVAWCAYAFINGSREFLDVISMVTFIFGELILRGQNVQSRMQEVDIKSTKKATKRIERKVTNKPSDGYGR